MSIADDTKTAFSECLSVFGDTSGPVQITYNGVTVSTVAAASQQGLAMQAAGYDPIYTQDCMVLNADFARLQAAGMVYESEVTVGDVLCRLKKATNGYQTVTLHMLAIR